MPATLLLTLANLALPAALTPQDPTLEIRFSQQDYVYARLARRPGRGLESRRAYYDLMLHSIAVVNKGTEPMTLDAIELELLAKGEVMQNTRILKQDIQSAMSYVAASARMGKPMFLDVPFGHRALFGPKEILASNLTLKKDAGLIINDLYLIVRGMPDELRVTAFLTGPDGPTEAVDSIAVSNRKAKNTYTLPLEAADWFVFADANLDSHHRFTQGTEFAVDITLVDDKGSPFQGNGRSWDDWYAYDKKVLAAAPGRVVKVVADSTLDPADFTPRDGESDARYQARISRRQQQRFLASGSDPLEVAGGNYICIAHEHGEFSQYLHLAHGTILVEEGDVVERGQAIAGVGGTGEIPWVHLHFQITDAFDPDDPLTITTAHSLPLNFKNVFLPTGDRRPPEPGLFVKMAK